WIFNEATRAMVPDDARMSATASRAFERLGYMQVLLMVSAYLESDLAIATCGMAAAERATACPPRGEASRFQGLVGETERMRSLYDKVERAAAASGNVLIVGESGTGK